MFVKICEPDYQSPLPGVELTKVDLSTHRLFSEHHESFLFILFHHLHSSRQGRQELNFAFAGIELQGPDEILGEEKDDISLEIPSISRMQMPHLWLTFLGMNIEPHAWPVRGCRKLKVKRQCKRDDIGRGSFAYHRDVNVTRTAGH